MIQVRTLAPLLVLGMTLTAPAAEPRARAAAQVRASLQALGGEERLRALRAVAWEAVGNRNMLEQSVRPEGPWLQDYFQVSGVRDLASGAERVRIRRRGFNTDDWEHSADWSEQTLLVAGGAAALESSGKLVPFRAAAVEEADEALAFAPERVLLTALDSQDLRAEPDVTFHGVPHHVVSFSWKASPVRLFLSAESGLPSAVELRRPLPYDVFWNVWGDVLTRTVFEAWTLEPGGLRYPRQWNVERNGLPETTLVITSLAFDPERGAVGLVIPEDVREAFHASRRTVDELPLGSPGAPAVEPAPGIVVVPGPWNVAFVRQGDSVVILEAPISPAYTDKVLQEAARRFPGARVSAAVSTSDSWPHVGGIREYVARGIAVHVLDRNRRLVERLLAAPHAQRPDGLERRRATPVLRDVSGRTALGEGVNRMELIPYRTANGERQLMVFFPEHHLLYTSDLFSPMPGGGWFTPQFVSEARDAVAREKLDVKTIFGMHYAPMPWVQAVTP